MTTPRRITLAITIALAALLLSAGLATAQDPPETATATRLEPGLNLVGWVGEPTPVSQLFREIPQLEAIWAWDAELRDWIVAAPGAPEWLGGLGRVTAGMGLRMQLGGDQPYLWRRSTEPTRGLVKLRTGWNLVAWSGADGAAIGDVVKGIGWSLRTVRRWDAANQQWVTWTSPERSAQVIASTGADQDADDDEMPGIRRGEALWIEVARAVNWLQPTDVLPRLVFPGGASQEVRQAAERLVGQFLTSSREAFGFEADASAYDIWMPASVEALRKAALEHGVTAERADSLVEQWDRAIGWVDSFSPGQSTIVLRRQPESAWETWGLLAHEYFHVVQSQLGSSAAPVWITEGTAEWAEDVYLVALGDVTWPDLHSWNSSFEHDFPLLQDLAFGRTGWWPYQFGWLATSQLIERGGPDSWIEFWRRLTPTGTGPHQRWQSALLWEDAFREVAGVSAAAFREAFASWAHEQTQQSSIVRRIRGRVTDASGRSVEGLRITATRTTGDPAGDLAMLEGIGWTRATTTPEGRFEIGVTHSGNYRISLDLGGGCTRHYSAGELINDGEPWNDWQDAQPVKVGQSDVSGIDVQLPPNVCGWQIRGRVVGPNAEPLAGITVFALPTGGGFPSSSTSAVDGSFAVTVNESGDYHVSARLGNGCFAYYAPKAPTVERDRASLITVSEGNVGGVSIGVPAGMCAYQMWGNITQADGQPLAGAWIGVCREVGDDCVGSPGQPTDDDGMFALTLPTEGSYRVWFNLEGCTAVHFRAGGLTTTYSERGTVRVEGRSVRLNPRQIPADMCARRISGRLVDSSGASASGTWISFFGGKSVLTDPDGQFTIRVPQDDAYSFAIWFTDNCSHQLAGQALGSPNNPVRVSGADVTGIVLQLPGTIEELCE